MNRVGNIGVEEEPPRYTLHDRVEDLVRLTADCLNTADKVANALSLEKYAEQAGNPKSIDPDSLEGRLTYLNDLTLRLIQVLARMESKVGFPQNQMKQSKLG